MFASLNISACCGSERSVSRHAANAAQPWGTHEAEVVHMLLQPVLVARQAQALQTGQDESALERLDDNLRTQRRVSNASEAAGACGDIPPSTRWRR